MDQELAQTQAEPVLQQVKFMPIAVGSLQQDSTTGFDLYIRNRPGAPPMLYRKAGLPFSEEACQRLLDRNIATLYVNAADKVAYRRYVETHIGEILADDTIPMPERSHLLYDSAQEMVKDLLQDARAGDIMERSGLMVEHMVAFMFRESTSFEHLMKVTSYDYYTYTHSVDVFVFSVALAQRLGLKRDAVQALGQGALLHDIGKSLIDPDILNCPGALSDEQWAIMRKHPEYGDEILREQGDVDSTIRDVVRHHHEKLSGKGYPDGQPCREISPEARIVAVGDIFSALTTNRPYKKAMGSFEALTLMKEKMAEDLDREYFRMFVQLMAGSGRQLANKKR